MSDRLLTLMQLAEKWGWSRSKLWRLVDRKEIPHLRFGERIHFRESVVEGWLLEREIPVKAAPRRPSVDRDPGREEMCRELGIALEHDFT